MGPLTLSVCTLRHTCFSFQAHRPLYLASPPSTLPIAAEPQPGALANARPQDMVFTLQIDIRTGLDPYSPLWSLKTGQYADSSARSRELSVPLACVPAAGRETPHDTSPSLFAPLLRLRTQRQRYTHKVIGAVCDEPAESTQQRRLLIWHVGFQRWTQIAPVLYFPRARTGSAHPSPKRSIMLASRRMLEVWDMCAVLCM